MACSADFVSELDMKPEESSSCMVSPYREPQSYVCPIPKVILYFVNQSINQSVIQRTIWRWAFLEKFVVSLELPLFVELGDSLS
jgi:hypothetical protein